MLVNKRVRGLGKVFEKNRGAISGAEKIWISGVFRLYLCFAKSVAPQHNFRKQVFKFCIRFALTLHSPSRLCMASVMKKL